MTNRDSKSTLRNEIAFLQFIMAEMVSLREAIIKDAVIRQTQAEHDDATKLMEQRDKAEGERDRLRVIVERLEWFPGIRDDGRCRFDCLWCRKTLLVGHADNCEVGLALAATASTPDHTG